MTDPRRKDKEITVPVNQPSGDNVATSARRRACLVVVAGLDTGSWLAVEQDEVIVGRDDTCDLTLRDDGVSRHHIGVGLQPDDTLLVTDRGSTNGTFFGQRRITEGYLRPGEKVILGLNSVLRYELQDGIDQVYQRRMHDARVRDWLTNAFNRRFFDAQLPAELSYAARQRQPLTIALLDIDHFKRINDTYGHPVGDAVLVAFCKALRQILRAEDLLARVGGEEFIVLARNTDLAGAKHLAERLRACVSDMQVKLAGRQPHIQITVSVGAVAVGSDPPVPAERVMAAVDHNLYLAKTAGRDQVYVSNVPADDLNVSKNQPFTTYRLRPIKVSDSGS